ncbi:alpha-tubulin N-acetyltransferase 1 isoform X3 [Betta splendens]|uniref:Alpha-tubulin N-acetyltransferase 1 n=1 Tax=Betta splendens TaxID=158456 RepID=A0A9W2Y4I6_BETSP|nr:alpha-tubulin N-acetyltransferase 1 isoform X3 [Betta splendens]
MEFPFNINHLFSERISVLDEVLVAGRKSVGRPDHQANIATVIDELGKASAKAQQLPASITSASKMQSQKHQLYLLKDGERNGGRGVLVGFLKVGYKKLFLLDQQGVHIEAEPLCVLDFYIAESLQRHGYGLELFDFMLQHKNLEPVMMAYDRPSPKFQSFLSKHYCLTQSVPQVNNFVVFEGFFLNRAAQLRKVPLKKTDGEIKPYSLLEREGKHLSVRQEQRALPWPFAPPHSPQLLVSSQFSHPQSTASSPSKAATRSDPASALGSSREQSPQSPLIERCRARRTNQRCLVAKCVLYSRHMDSRDVGPMEGHLPGVRPVGDKSHTDTHSLSSTHTLQSRSQALLPLSASKDGIRSLTFLSSKDTHLDTKSKHSCSKGVTQPLAGNMFVNQRVMERKSQTSQQGWSWTVGENCCTAQSVKQKQEYRGTRPW